MRVPEDYNPLELILALRQAKAKEVKASEGYKAALVIKTARLNEIDKHNLEEAFVGEYMGDAFYHWICDHFMEPLQFESSTIARENAESQKRALETRLLYDIYKRTGVKLQAPHKNAVQII